MFCSRCGAATPEGAVFCGSCGQSLGAPAPAAAPGYPVQVAPAAAMYRPLYAGFWLRFVAYIIDALIIGIPFGAIILIMLAGTGVLAGLQNIHPGESPDAIFALVGIGAFFGALVIALLGSWLYYAWCESSEWQATPGEESFGALRHGHGGAPHHFRPRFRAFLRQDDHRPDSLGIGYMLAGFTAKKQALHDMIASCLVMRKN